MLVQIYIHKSTTVWVKSVGVLLLNMSRNSLCSYLVLLAAISGGSFASGLMLLYGCKFIYHIINYAKA